MYERFTDRARNVMKMANQEAQRFNHEYVGTEHVLLGLTRETGVATTVLQNLNVDLGRIRLEVEKLIQSGPDMVTMGRLPATPAAKRAIEYAMQECRKLEHNQVDTEHLLLGLLREDQGVAYQILLNLGLRVDQVRAEIKSVLGWHDEQEQGYFVSQLPTRPATQTSEGVVEPPKACPKCGQHLIRVIWRWVHLFGSSLNDVTAGRAIFGSPVDKDGPPWVCLHCAPRWFEVHRLALREHELQVEKENAIVSRNFERAIQCRDEQTVVRRALIVLLDELSREQTP
jgi:hypothetical protein